MYLIAKLPEGDRAFCLNGGTEWTIGRNFDNDIALLAVEVSRHHATLKRFALGFQIQDHRSFNGTWIGERKLPWTLVYLSGEETIRFGTIECYFSTTGI